MLVNLPNMTHGYRVVILGKAYKKGVGIQKFYLLLKDMVSLFSFSYISTSFRLVRARPIKDFLRVFMCCEAWKALVLSQGITGFFFCSREIKSQISLLTKCDRVECLKVYMPIIFQKYTWGCWKVLSWPIVGVSVFFF